MLSSKSKETTHSISEDNTPPIRFPKYASYSSKSPNVDPFLPCYTSFHKLEEHETIVSITNEKFLCYHYIISFKMSSMMVYLYIYTDSKQYMFISRGMQIMKTAEIDIWQVEEAETLKIHTTGEEIEGNWTHHYGSIRM